MYVFSPDVVSTRLRPTFTLSYASTVPPRFTVYDPRLTIHDSVLSITHRVTTLYYSDDRFLVLLTVHFGCFFVMTCESCDVVPSGAFVVLRLGTGVAMVLLRHRVEMFWNVRTKLLYAYPF